ncbi:MAG: glycosyltransferase [Candidatus Hydrogenedentes bacterium]|nr:glycosyltransferase [Candidatus Hydrogenedentota bacterium]
MSTLSVIMIVKNEAAMLGECLRGVADIADEVVVGDTGSTDDTAAIAKSFGARVHTVPWENDFARARNRTIELAWGRWLLHLDADEVVDPENAARIREIVDTDTESDAVEVTLANYCNDVRAWRWVASPPGSPYSRHFSGYLPVGLLRLFRNRHGIEYREAVHENITASVRELGGVIRSSSILIHHYGYECGEARRLEKAHFYLDLARRKVAASPEDVKSLHDLAEAALACGETGEAELACRRALGADPAHVGAATALANICLNRGDLDEARALLMSLERAGHTEPHIQTALGATALHRGALDEAERRLRDVCRAHPPAPVAALYLSRVLDYGGDGAGALTVLRDLSARMPALEEAGRRIRALEARQSGEEAYTRGEARAALRCFVAALQEDREDALAHNGAGVALHALGQCAQARDAFMRALQLAPTFSEARQNLEVC